MTVTVFLVRLLVLAVIFVNGWTDAPNAIATAVGSGAMPFKRAVWLAAGCNFLGAAVSCLVFPAVAATMEELVSFARPQDALTALCAAMLAVVAWATAAWRFGLPTSESHALLAGLSGGALALGGGSAALNPGAWLRVGLGLVLSLLAGALAGRMARCFLSRHICNCIAWQRIAAGVMAALHGVQDGQKFLALLLLADGLGEAEPSLPLSLLMLTAGVMALGTALGGRPIVEKVGSGLAALSPADGLAADLGAGVVLLACSLLGLPVSTTHAKVAAILGAGRRPDRRIAGEIGGAWLLTFPACGLLAFLLARMMT
mgnify:CR=1 FL=1